jgi:hypothetical protein
MESAVADLQTVFEVDPRPVAGQAGRIGANVNRGGKAYAANAFDYFLADAIWEFAAARANSANNLVTAILAVTTPAGLRALANAERRVPESPGAAAALGPELDDQSGGHLTYLSIDGNDGAVRQVMLPAAITKQQLMALGKARFDTTFVRNLFFITNVVRLVRLKLNRELSQSRNVIVASDPSVSASVTEFGSDPFGPNETTDSTIPSASRPGGIGRFNDKDEL